MLDRPIIQHLTPLFEVGHRTNTSTHFDTRKLARIFTSLTLAIQGLSSFYDDLNRENMDPTRLYPYLRHFEVDGHRTDFRYDRILFPNKLVFQASVGSGTNKRAIIVKFAESYNVEAHRLLAEAQLAPALLYVSSEHGIKVAELSMIVMEKVQGQDLTRFKSVPRCVKDNVSDALELLHKRRIVFGDLQPSNVMVVVDDQGQIVGGMLVDFDWCGIDGEAKYPATMGMET